MAVPIYITDDVPSATEINEFMVNVGFIAKASDETVTSSAVLQDDNHLTLPVVANAIYIVQILLFSTSTSATPGCAWTLTGPAGATIFAQALGPGDGQSSNSIGSSVQSQLPTLGSAIQHGSFAGAVHTLVGQLVIGSTAGSILVRWAQTHSNATGTTVKAGSWLQLYRVA